MLHTFVLSYIVFTRLNITFTRLNITFTRWKNDKIRNVVLGFCQGALYFPNVIGVHGTE
jgi:hypothetical protein